MITHPSRSLLPLSIIAFLGCASHANDVSGRRPVDIEPYWPTVEWRSAGAEDVSLDAGRIASLVQSIDAGSYPGVDGFVLVRHGYVIAETYRLGFDRDALHTQQSVSKSVASLLLGILSDQNKVDTNETIVSIFNERYAIQNLDERKRAMRLKDLLMMRTGMDWSEANYNTSPLKQLNECFCDWYSFFLNWRMREDPGTRWEYNSGGVILFAGIIEERSDMTVDAFAQEHLFGPLGITSFRFSQNPNGDGTPHLGGGLFLRPLDMAKLGLLLLKRGEWDGQQVVSSGWIDASLQRRSTNSWPFSGRTTNYGFLWWMMPLNGSSFNGTDEDVIITAAGARGQWIFTIPAYDLVAVFTGNSDATAGAPVSILYDRILPAVTDR